MSQDPTSLERLHDVIAPPPVPWWPPAPGWLWLLAAVAVATLAGGLWLFRHWQQNRYRREALAEWKRLEGELAGGEQSPAVLAAFAELLKRTALSGFSRAEVAALIGTPWHQFLTRTAPECGLSAETLSLLEGAAYQPGVSIPGAPSSKEAAEQVRAWIEHHRRPEAC